jgi:Ca2+/Na+ antiporter
MLYYSVPDVESHPSQRQFYGRAIAAAALWLAIFSFIMINCCSVLGSLWNITPLQMGLTLSAIGTSFPNLWSSMIVAREGLGDMAVSNALGSNTFNTCIGLGLPLFLYIISTLNDGDYNSMQDGGVVVLILLLITVLIIFYTVIALAGYKITTPMGYAFVLTYIASIIYTLSLTAPPPTS